MGGLCVASAFPVVAGDPEPGTFIDEQMLSLLRIEAAIRYDAHSHSEMSVSYAPLFVPIRLGVARQWRVMATNAALRDVTGFRGEKLVELRLTDYSAFPAPLFRPGFLGDKWPAIDFYVELTTVSGLGMYFFGQAKATAAPLKNKARVLKISSDRSDVVRLQAIPAPTYIFGIHEPTNRVFARAVLASTPLKSISSIPLTHELTATNLQSLHDEVVAHWRSRKASKPKKSVFS